MLINDARATPFANETTIEATSAAETSIMLTGMAGGGKKEEKKKNQA